MEEPQTRLPFPIVKDQGIPLACWSCWWREGGRCYNEKLADIPEEKVTFTNAYGTQSYNRRLGNEITDDYYQDCHEKRAFANRRAVFLGALVGEQVIKNEFNGEKS